VSAPSPQNPDAPPLPLISVVICTYNRAVDTKRAARSLLDQRGVDVPWELIVVDNNSTDATADVVRSLAAADPRVRYCREEQQGLSHARNRGWREARGRYVGYLDDDAIARAGWLAAAERIIAAHSPAMFGGPYYPFYTTPRPPWFKDEYGSRELAAQDGPLPPDETLSGGNMFARRDLLESLGGYSSGFGMTGNRIAYGEETHLQQRLRAQKPDALIYYDRRLAIDHLVRADKMLLSWRWRQAIAQGRDIQRMAHLREGGLPGRGLSLFLLARAFAKLLYHGVCRLLLRDRKRYPFVRQYLYEKVFFRVKEIAQCWTQLRRSF
jgi:glycosyltransferase involved in cell wall biosynthesis